MSLARLQDAHAPGGQNDTLQSRISPAASAPALSVPRQAPGRPRPGRPERPTAACVAHCVACAGEAVDQVKAGVAVAELRCKVLTDALRQHALDDAADGSIVADGGTRTHLLAPRAGHALHVEVATDTTTATEDLRRLLGDAGVDVAASTTS